MRKKEGWERGRRGEGEGRRRGEGWMDPEGENNCIGYLHLSPRNMSCSSYTFYVIM